MNLAYPILAVLAFLFGDRCGAWREKQDHRPFCNCPGCKQWRCDMAEKAHQMAVKAEKKVSE